MKLFTNTRFDGIWPFSKVAAVVVATDADHAAALLQEKLCQVDQLRQAVSASDMEEVSLDEVGAFVLNDGGPL
jgi:microcompartment protein CcmK/EutM